MAWPLLLGLAAATPLLRGASCGHDFDFHLQSWFAVRAAWQHGLLVPHWVPGANYGAGEPRFVFYPPLSWLLGAALGAVLPWAYVPAAFTALCVAGAAAAMYRLASLFCPQPPAALAATLYALCPYLVFTAYERAAYGELLAAVWMPLLVGTLLVPRLPIIRVALLIAALWYTNAPAAVVGCYLVLLAALGTAIVSPGARVPVPLRSVAALVLGCALGADYLLPAWYEQRFVSIHRAIGPGMRIEDSFLFAHTGEPFHDQVLRTASWIAIATFTVAFAAAAIVLVRRRSSASPAPPLRATALPFATGAENDQWRTGRFLCFVAGACALLQFPFTALLWDHLPELQFLQFPWRLLLLASVAAALLAVLAAVRVRRRWPVYSVIVLYAAGMMYWAAATRYQPCDEEDNVAAQLVLFGGGAGFEGTDEYAAAGSDNGEIQQALPKVRLLSSPGADEGDDSVAPSPAWVQPPSPVAPTQLRIDRWQPESAVVRVHPVTDAYAVLRLERSPEWLVLLDGQPCGNACVARDDGLLTVHVPPGRWTTIDARYRTTADVFAGRTTTCMAGLWVVAVAARRRSAAAAGRPPSRSAIQL